MSEPTKGGGLLYASIFLQKEKIEKLKAQNEKFLHGAIEVANDNNILEGVARKLIEENVELDEARERVVEENIDLAKKDSNIAVGRQGGASTQKQNGKDRIEIFRRLAKRIKNAYPGWDIDVVIPKIQKIINKNIKSNEPEFSVYKKLYKNGRNYGDKTIEKAINDMF